MTTGGSPGREVPMAEEFKALSYRLLASTIFLVEHEGSRSVLRAAGRQRAQQFGPERFAAALARH